MIIVFVFIVDTEKFTFWHLMCVLFYVEIICSDLCTVKKYRDNQEMNEIGKYRWHPFQLKQRVWIFPKLLAKSSLFRVQRNSNAPEALSVALYRRRLLFLFCNWHKFDTELSDCPSHCNALA